MIVSIAPLKEKAYSFPDPVRSMILSIREDAIDSTELIAKAGEWAKVLKMDMAKRA